MSFKKLIPEINEALERLDYENPLPFQKKILGKIKSGSNIFGIAPSGSGKTTSIIIGTIQTLEGKAMGDMPRALIFVKDKDAALELEEKFKKFTRHTDLRVFTAFQGPDIENQKIAIYEGMDIVISTPAFVHKLFKITGIHLGQLKLFVVEDAEFLTVSRDFNYLIQMPPHIPKCQYLVFATEFTPKIERLEESFMEHSEIVLEN
ncbi:MAG TPA: DEAD/DEAH box helicase [Salinimicrobium sp.]|nr:DEAD/DEAH box helicase [Salinimicrobium sp.]